MKFNVLIVDDEKNIVSTIAMALKSNSYMVHTAESGEKALGIQGRTESG